MDPEFIISKRYSNRFFPECKTGPVNLTMRGTVVFFGEMIDQLKLGDHVAFFFKTNEERLSMAISYIKIGLERNERCLYIADDNCVFDILLALQNAGVDVRKHQNT